MRSLKYFVTFLIIALSACAGSDLEDVVVEPVITEEEFSEVSSIKEPENIVSPEDPGGEGVDVPYPSIPGDLVTDPYWLESDTLGSLEGVTLGCTDPLASNYDTSVPPEGEDGTCTYDGYAVPAMENTKTTYRNVLVEVYTASWCEECIIPNEAINIAKENLGNYNRDNDTNHEVIDVYLHVNGSLVDPLANSTTNSKARDFSVEANTLPYVFFDQIDEPNYILGLSRVSRSMHNEINARVSHNLNNPHLVDIAITSDFNTQQLEGFFSLKIRTGEDLPTKRRMNYAVFVVENEATGSQRNVAADNSDFSPQYDKLVSRGGNITNYAHPFVVRAAVIEGYTASVKFLNGEAVFTRKFVYDNASTNTINSTQTERFFLVLVCYDNDRLWVWNSAKVALYSSITW